MTNPEDAAPAFDAQALAQQYIDDIDSTYKMLSFDRRDYPNEADFYASARRNADAGRHIMDVNDRRLQQYIYPYVYGRRPIDQAAFEALRTFAALLADNTQQQDMMLGYRINRVILPYAQAQGDPALVLPLLYQLGIATYSMGWYGITEADHMFGSECRRYFQQGAAYADRYAELTDAKTRGYVLRCIGNQSLTIRALDPASTHQHFDELRAELAAFDRLRAITPQGQVPWDAFYTAMYRNRLSAITMIRRGHQLTDQEMAEMIDSAEHIWRAATRSGHASAQTTYLYLATMWHAHRITDRQLYGGLMESVVGSPMDDYSTEGIDAHITTPARIAFYIRYMSFMSPTERQQRLASIYEQVMKYAMNFHNFALKSTFSKRLMECFVDFRDLPGEYKFSDLLMRALMAQHVPSYIHSLVVSRLSVHIAGRLLAAHVTRLDGVRRLIGRDHDEAVIDYVRQAALLHDCGKISCIDDVANNTRQLFAEEFIKIRTHPAIGAECLSNQPSTAIYVDVAHGHHRWYNGKGGYPEDFDAQASPVREVIEIVSIADALDAGTDFIDRVQSRLKTFDDIMGELTANAGTRYNPYFVNLLRQPDQQALLAAELEQARRDAYAEAYAMLQ